MTPRRRITDLNGLTITFGVGDYHAEMLGWGFIKPKWWRNYLHEHSFFEVCYAYQGAGTFYMDYTGHTVRTSDVFIARPGEPHEIISSEDDPLGIYFWSYTLVPTDKPTNTSLNHMLRQFIHTKRHTNQAGHLQTTLRLLTEEVVNRQAGYQTAIESLCVKLVLDVARVVTDATLQDHEGYASLERDQQLVLEIERYIHDNYNRALLLRDVAAYVHLSERHTNRVFQQVKGESIKTYLTRYRLNIAKQLLLNERMTITQVAFAIGYNDIRYFSTRFRQHTGQTPTQFREQRGTVFHAGK